MCNLDSILVTRTADRAEAQFGPILLLRLVKKIVQNGTNRL